MGGNPGDAAAVAVVVADLGDSFSAGSPVFAGVVGGVRVGATVGLSASENVMHVWLAADAVDEFVLFVDCVVFGDEVAEEGQLDCVALEMGDIAGDHGSFCVVPGTGADAVASADSGLTGFGRGTEISLPGCIGGTGCGSQFLAVSVSSGEAAEVGTVAHPDAGDEEAHGSGRLLLCRLLGQERDCA